MRLNTPSNPLLFIAMALLLGCAFDPAGDNFKEIKVTEPKPVSLDFFNSHDTLFLRGSVALLVNFPDDKDILSYSASIEDKLVTDGPGRPFEIYIDSKKFTDGFHVLKLEVYKKTNSNSLADKFDAEAFVLTYTKPVLIDNSQISSESIKITEIAIEDSTLVVKWTPYIGSGFKSYTISIEGTGNLIVITDQSKSKANIEYYTGGQIELSIYLSAYEKVVMSNKKSFYYDIGFQIEHPESPTGEFNLRWNPSPFKSWDGLEISIANVSFYDLSRFYEEIKVDKSLTTFQFTHQVQFPYHFDIGISHSDPYNIHSAAVHGQSFSTGFDIKNEYLQYYNQFHFLNDSAYLMLQSPIDSYSNQIVSLRSTQSQDPILVRSGIFALSPDANKLFEFDSWKIKKLHTEDFSVIDQVDVTAYLNEIGTFVAIESSNNGNVLLLMRLNTALKFYVWNWNSKTIIHQGDIQYGYRYSKLDELSPNGDFLFGQSSDSYDLGNVHDVQGILYATFSSGGNHFLTSKKSYITHYLGNILQRDLFWPYSSIYIPYSKSIKRIISNQKNEFGIIYVENQQINIDFFRQGSLNFLGTVILSKELFYTDALEIFLDRDRLIVKGKQVHVKEIDFF
jgi:hypothetical protein